MGFRGVGASRNQDRRDRKGGSSAPRPGPLSPPPPKKFMVLISVEG